jgi:uncharacterized protein YodC (DUF2158 family)
MQPVDREAAPGLAHAFNPGDKVMLRSGGPGMTVVDVGRHTGRVVCCWLAGDGHLREACLPAEALRPDPRDATPGYCSALPPP